MPGTVRPVTDERDGLLAFLDQQRQALRNAAYGLTDEQARATPTPSSLSVGGLVRHVTQVEQNWQDMILSRRKPYEQGQTDYLEAFTLGRDQTLASALEQYAAVADATTELIASIEDLGRPVPVPKDVPWFPRDLDAWSVRWVLLHLIQETARHAGHADIVRESVDGATAYPLMAAIENWPETPWMKRWQPAGV